ncbi:MAG: ABC transporter substrate-binding protein, partial [Thermoplasmata archaeon]
MVLIEVYIAVCYWLLAFVVTHCSNVNLASFLGSNVFGDISQRINRLGANEVVRAGGSEIISEIEEHYFNYDRDSSTHSIKKSALAIGVALIMVSIGFQVLITEIVAADTGTRTLTIAMAEPIDSANPYVCINDNSYVFVAFIYGSLTKPDENGTPSPDLARSWWFMNGSYAAATGSDFSNLVVKNPNDWPLGSIWEYNLTDNAFWSDGIPFNADDVIFSFNMQIGPNFATYWSYQPYTRWIAQAEKIDDYKVRIFYADIDTGEPFPIAFGDNVYIPIMPAHIFASQPLSYIAMEWNGAPTIGTGPWIATQNLIDELVAQETVTLRKNPYYRFTDPEDGTEKGLGYVEGKDTQVDQIKLKFFSEETTLALAIRNGNADCGKIQANTFLSWQQDEGLPRSISLMSMVSATDYSKQIVINDFEDAPGTLNPLRLDPAVQRAIAIATNKTWIKNNVYKGLAELGVGLISPATQRWYWQPDESPSTFNVTGAVYNSTSKRYELAGVVYSYTKPLNKIMEYDIAEANRILNAAGYVWANESNMIVRKAGPLAATRMEAMGFGNASTLLNKKLVFEHVVEMEVFEDKQVGDFIISDWEKIGVWISTASGDHTSSLVNSATWNTLIYSYTFNTMQTYWSGDIDPNYLLYAPTT